MSYNDCLMFTYLCLGLYYFLIKKNVSMTAVFISLGLGIKTSIFAVFPSIMGSIQWQYGTKPLLMFVLINVVIHAVAAGPFVFSGKTQLTDYLRQSCLSSNSDKFRGAKDYHDSVFWRFIGRAMYYMKAFNHRAYPVMMIINVYYFFIVRNNLKKCIYRFADTIM